MSTFYLYKEKYLIAEAFFNPENCRNESEVESKFIVHYLLPQLGYHPNDWSQEITLANHRFDFLVVSPTRIKPQKYAKLLIEAKHPQENLNNHLRKFRQYLESIKAHFGLITNGKIIQVYERINEQIKLILEVLGRDVEKRISEIKKLIGKEEIINAISRNRGKQQVLGSSQLGNNMKVIGVYHNKGGVGKTTTVVNLAAALSKKGQRVLVIDLDSQANTTYAAGLIKFHDESHDNIKENYIYHLIREKNEYFISDVVRRSQFTTPEFDVIPSHINLMHHEKELAEIDATRTRIIAKLEKVKDKYSIVLIDTPPSLNLYAKVALIAADYLIIPSDLKPFANEGLINLKNFLGEINEFKEVIGKKQLEILGVLPSKIGTHHRFVQNTLPEMETTVRERYGFELMKSRIFERRDVSAAIENTIEVGDLDIPDPKSIFDYKPESKAAEEFENLATEVMELIGIK